MDRGANGRIAGSDARVIETHPDYKVDIHDIDIHEITAILLLTAGGVTSNVTGKVIIIMHQHAFMVRIKPSIPLIRSITTRP